MTNLYIAGVAVVLPEDFKANITEENPFITKKGEYSYDIELSLLNPINAKLYKHINRLNFSGTDIENRTADLIVKDQPKLKGIEIILGFTNTSVKIQVASGNSALNYVFSQNNKIWENNFGEAPLVSVGTAWEILDQQYPATNCTYPPFLVMQDSSSYVYNITRSICNMWIAAELADQPATSGSSPLVPCPYLMYYIEKFVELKGFTLKSNILRSDARAMKCYLLNPQKTRTYADILPDWTEREFVDEVQKFFNVRFIVNAIDNSIDIVRDSSQVVAADTIELKKVLKVFEQNRNQSNTNAETYKNVAYNLPSNNYFDYQKLSDGVLENLWITDVADYDTLSALITRDAATWGGLVNTRHIYRTVNDNQYYMLYGFQYGVDDDDAEDDQFWFGLRNIDIYRDFIVSPTATKLSLKITPARMMINRWFHSQTTVSQLNFPYQYPWCSEMPVQAEFKNLIQLIEEGVNTWRPALLELCMYTGKKTFTWATTSGNLYDARLPFSHTDNLCEMKDVAFGVPNWETIRSSWYTETDTFRLNGPGGIAESYYTETNYDETKPTTVYFLPQSDFNVKSNILINNKKFVCEKIEYDVNKHGVVDNTIKGTFYPVLE